MGLSSDTVGTTKDGRSYSSWRIRRSDGKLGWLGHWSWRKRFVREKGVGGGNKRKSGVIWRIVGRNGRRIISRRNKNLIRRRNFPTRWSVRVMEKGHSWEEINGLSIEVFDESNMEGIVNGVGSRVPQAIGF